MVELKANKGDDPVALPRFKIESLGRLNFNYCCFGEGEQGNIMERGTEMKQRLRLQYLLAYPVNTA